MFLFFCRKLKRTLKCQLIPHVIETGGENTALKFWTLITGTWAWKEG